MTLDVILSNRFKKDLKLAKKRGYNLNLLDEVVTTLATSQTLDEKYRDHSLNGEYAGFRECHIQPDWLLVYRIDYDEIFYYFRVQEHILIYFINSRPLYEVWYYFYG